jgi:methyl-accepting chemotaxis protein
MLHWFEAVAPIRQKMLVIAWSSAAMCLLTGTVAAILGGYAGIVTALIGAGLCFGLGMMFRTRICDPYVNTVVRMEALAAGDLASEIAYTDHQDCVGRMTKAMFSFRDTAQRLGDIQGNVVALMNKHLAQLAAGDLTATIDEAVASEYGSLKHNFNAAVHALSLLIGQVGAATAAIKSGSSEIAVASEALARRTHSSAASMEEATA